MWDLISILADKIISDLSLIAFQLDIRPRQTPKNWNYRCPHLTVCRRWWNTGINWKRDVPFSIFRYFGFKLINALIFHSQDLKVNFLSVFLRYSFYLSSKTLVPSERMFTNWCLPLFHYPCTFNSCDIVRRNSILSTPGSNRVKRYASTHHYVVQARR